MDQKQTGKFIAEMRRERGLTQKELADRLLISDKTVSKWECGGGFPEVSLMIPLCNELGITVNELLSGKRLQASEYQKSAEENMVRLMREKAEARSKLVLEGLIVFITLLAAVTLCIVIGYVDMALGWKIAVLAIAFTIIFVGVAMAIVLERMATDFECSCCHQRFVPTVGAYLMGMHTMTRRLLKCPKCGVRNWCRLCVKTDPDKTESK